MQARTWCHTSRRSSSSDTQARTWCHTWRSSLLDTQARTWCHTWRSSLLDTQARTWCHTWRPLTIRFALFTKGPTTIQLRLRQRTQSFQTASKTLKSQLPNIDCSQRHQKRATYPQGIWASFVVFLHGVHAGQQKSTSHQSRDSYFSFISTSISWFKFGSSHPQVRHKGLKGLAM